MTNHSKIDRAPHAPEMAPKMACPLVGDECESAKLTPRQKASQPMISHICKLIAPLMFDEAPTMIECFLSIWLVDGIQFNTCLPFEDQSGE